MQPGLKQARLPVMVSSTRTSLLTTGREHVPVPLNVDQSTSSAHPPLHAQTSPSLTLPSELNPAAPENTSAKMLTVQEDVSKPIPIPHPLTLQLNLGPLCQPATKLLPWPKIWLLLSP